MALLALEGGDDVAEGRERLVDVLRLLEARARGLRSAHALAAGQVHQHQLSQGGGARGRVRGAEVDEEEGVGAGGVLVRICGSCCSRPLPCRHHVLHLLHVGHRDLDGFRHVHALGSPPHVQRLARAGAAPALLLLLLLLPLLLPLLLLAPSAWPPRAAVLVLLLLLPAPVLRLLVVGLDGTRLERHQQVTGVLIVDLNHADSDGIAVGAAPLVRQPEHFRQRAVVQAPACGGSLHRVRLAGAGERERVRRREGGREGGEVRLDLSAAEAVGDEAWCPRSRGAATRPLEPPWGQRAASRTLSAHMRSSRRGSRPWPR